MRVAVTGHGGYIGTVLTPMLRAAGHDVVGFDLDLFEACVPLEPLHPLEERRIDIRDITRVDLRGFDAVIHLAAVSNDPMGDLNPQTTYAINHLATVSLAEAAKAAGVERFLFSSSCSLYGAADRDRPIDEEADFNPVTPYGHAKVLAEQGLAPLADDTFSPTYLRNATAYGYSPRLRVDLVVNNLTAHAITTGRIHMQSDGTPWRPLVHVEDISRAFLAVLHASRESIHDQAFNVGRTEDNFRVREIAEMVGARVDGSEVTFAAGAGPDKRSYRVSFDKIAEWVPGFEPVWTVPRAIEDLVTRLRKAGLTRDELFGERFVRLEHLRRLLETERIDDQLRWRVASQPSSV